MDIPQLRSFLAAAEAASISRAAERLGLAQPTLSQHLGRLETSLGVRLFDRLGRGVALTDAGKALLPRARRILAELRDAELNLKREAEQGAGSVSIGAIPTMAPYLLPPALKKVVKDGEEVFLREALTGQLVEALLDNELDVAITSTPLLHDHLEVDVIGHEELLAVVPASHPLAAKATVSWADLDHQPVVSLSEMHCLGQQIRGFCTAKNIGPRVACSTTQLGTIFELVALGLGVSLVPEMAAAHQHVRSCRFLRLASAKPVRQIAAAYRKGRTHPRLGQRLIHAVRDQIGSGLHRLP
jgi:LysR family hydrogen peroxide-inducible transcriptional activator